MELEAIPSIGSLESEREDEEFKENDVDSLDGCDS
jgi:hypothetical protein